MNIGKLQHRANLVNWTSEKWRPPAINSQSSRWAKLLGVFRRFLDLQAGSIWRDLRQVLPQAKGVILDVGCGGQPYRCLTHSCTQYIALDYVGATDNFGYQTPDTTYYQGDVWPMLDNTADVILCTETLEHVPDPVRFLAEATRCVKPGGLLLLSVPFAARWHFIPHDYWRFTPAGIKRLMQEAGFIEIVVLARGNAVTVACYKAMALLLPFVFPQAKTIGRMLVLSLVGLLLAPILFALAVVGNISLFGSGGADCLGYTVLAKRPNKDLT